MLHNTRYNKDSLLKLVSLLKSKDEILTFIKAHQTAIKFFESLAEATPFIIYILQNTLRYYNDRAQLSSDDDIVLKSFIEILNPLFSYKHDIDAITEFLNALTDRRGSCHTLENCRLYFVKALSANIQNVTDLNKAMHYITNNEKLIFAKTMHHLITNPDELAILVATLASNTRVDMMNHVEAHWEIDYRTKCRMAFLSASICPDARSYGFFKSYVNDGNRGIPQLKKMILDFAELEPYHSPDDTVKESHYSLK